MPATRRRVIRAMCPMSCHLLSPAARHADLVLPVEAEPVSFVDAQCAPQAIIATLLIEYGLRARDRTEAGLGSFERLAVRHAIFHTDD
jgi:DNA-binding MurR/RpiR family transcriptional regulator